MLLEVTDRSRSSKKFVNCSTNCRAFSLAYWAVWYLPFWRCPLCAGVWWWSPQLPGRPMGNALDSQLVAENAGRQQNTNIFIFCNSNFASRMMMMILTSQDPKYCSSFLLTWRSASATFFFEDDSSNAWFTFEPDACLRQRRTTHEINYSILKCAF